MVEKFNHGVIDFTESVPHIILSDTKSYKSVCADILKDIELTSYENGVVEIKGTKEIFNFTTDRIYIDKLGYKPNNVEIHTTIFKKREWFSGIYKTNKTQPYHIKLSKWVILYE